MICLERFKKVTPISWSNMISTYTLNHLGLVAGACKELGIAKIIDRLIPPDPQQKVTTGQSVVSMIINGLGFTNRPLYLYPQFFEKKPVELLIGKDVNADMLNDDTIGRALDRVFEYGCTELFCTVSYQAAKIADVNKKFGHLDTTTFSVYGEYASDDLDNAPIKITYGTSKKKRPDLKQIFLNLLVSFDGGIPLFMQALDGNSSDVTTFRKTVSEFKKGIRKNLQEITYLIADSKFYTKETIKMAKNDLSWISRVPDNITKANDLIEETTFLLDELDPLENEGYSYRKHQSNYGGVKQRWLIIHSKQAEKRARGTVTHAVKQEYKKLQKLTKKLQKKEFHCKKDTQKSLDKIQEKTKFHTVTCDKIIRKEKYKNPGRPPKNKKKNKKKKVTYFPRYQIKREGDAIEFEIKKKAIFIIATNEMSKKKLTDQEVFDNYKGQHKVERGFRFLKDPLFFASSLFLKKPERIVALTLIMCLSLLVYSIVERKLRKLLKEHGQTIRNQVKKPTQTPTLRWIFQLFEDVHFVKIEENDNVTYEIKNLRADGEIALGLLGEHYMEPYLLEHS